MIWVEGEGLEGERTRTELLVRSNEQASTSEPVSDATAWPTPAGGAIEHAQARP
jgi:hypothetical protein